MTTGRINQVTNNYRARFPCLPVKHWGVAPKEVTDLPNSAMNHDFVIKFHNTMLLEQKPNNRKPSGRHRKLHLLTVSHWGNKASKGVPPLHDQVVPRTFSERHPHMQRITTSLQKQDILISELGNGNRLISHALPPRTLTNNFLGTMQNNNQIRMEVITTNQPK